MPSYSLHVIFATFIVTQRKTIRPKIGIRLISKPKSKLQRGNLNLSFVSTNSYVVLYPSVLTSFLILFVLKNVRYHKMSCNISTIVKNILFHEIRCINKCSRTTANDRCLSIPLIKSLHVNEVCGKAC